MMMLSPLYFYFCNSQRAYTSPKKYPFVERVTKSLFYICNGYVNGFSYLSDWAIQEPYFKPGHHLWNVSNRMECWEVEKMIPSVIYVGELEITMKLRNCLFKVCLFQGLSLAMR
jgi:hypothetical protein